MIQRVGLLQLLKDFEKLRKLGGYILLFLSSRQYINGRVDTNHFI